MNNNSNSNFNFNNKLDRLKLKLKCKQTEKNTQNIYKSNINLTNAPSLFQEEKNIQNILW